MSYLNSFNISINTEVALPYIYKLTFKTTGEYYYGSRWANKLPAIEDIVKYQSSSETIELKGFENFDYEILQENDTGEQVWYIEQLLITNSIGDKLCLNKHYFDVFKSDKKFILVGHTEKTKQSMRKPKTDNGNFTGRVNGKKSAVKLKGRPKSDATKKNMSIARRNRKQEPKQSVETRQKRSDSLTGTVRSPEFCAGISAREKGKKKPAGFGAKVSAALTGRKRDPKIVQKQAKSIRRTNLLKSYKKSKYIYTTHI